jgi:hypothetical protein
MCKKTKGEKREHRKKSPMKVSGKSVFELKSIIDKKPEKKKK